MTPEALAAHAYDLAAQGYPVFPCKKSKQPATAHGFYNAVADPNQARSLFRSCQDAALIGMPTGTRSGIAVIDIDPAAVHWFRDHMTKFAETRMHQTRRGGFHLLYQCPDPPIKNTAGKLYRGCDTRGEGGYIIFPPSDGYTIVHEAEIAPLPKWIIRALNRKPKVTQADEAGTSRSGNLGALERFIEHSQPGERNVRAFWGACRAGEMVRGGKASASEARAAIVHAAMATGLDAVEAQLVATSGLRRGQMQ